MHLISDPQASCKNNIQIHAQSYSHTHHTNITVRYSSRTLPLITCLRHSGY
jgi:hypothetical protein